MSEEGGRRRNGEGRPHPGDDEIVRELYEHRERVQALLAAQEGRFYEHRDQVRKELADHREQVRDRLAAQDATISSWWRLFGYGGAGAAVVALCGFLWLSISLTGKVQSRLDDEFSAPRIRRMIDQAAQKAAVEQLQPQVDEAKRAVAPLQRMQGVMELQAKAANGSRVAFDELRQLSREGEDASVRELARGAYLMIGAAYALQGWGGDLTVTDPDGRVRKNDQLTSDELLNLLAQGDDRERGLASLYIYPKRDPRAVPVLVSLIKPGGERNLLSVGHEILALRQLVPSIPHGETPYDTDEIMAWWAIHEHDFGRSEALRGQSAGAP